MTELDSGSLSAPEISAPAPVAEAPAAEPSAPDSTPNPEPSVKAVPDKPSPPLSIKDALLKARERATAPETGDRVRDEQGRFKATEGQETPLAKAPELKAPDIAKPEPPKPVATADVPSRFSPDAKAAWATTPEPVRAEVNRALAELQTGLTQYQQRFEPLKPYFQIAEQSGTTVDAALKNYVELANERRSNPKGFIDRMLREIGSSPEEYAAIVSGQPAPAQGQQPEIVNTLLQEITALNSRSARCPQTTRPAPNSRKRSSSIRHGQPSRRTIPVPTTSWKT